MHGNIPNTFDCWAYAILLLKSSTVVAFSRIRALHSLSLSLSLLFPSHLSVFVTDKRERNVWGNESKIGRKSARERERGDVCSSLGARLSSKATVTWKYVFLETVLCNATFGLYDAFSLMWDVPRMSCDTCTTTFFKWNGPKSCKSKEFESDPSGLGSNPLCRALDH